MISLTQIATDKLTSALQDRKLRVLVKTTGCSGLAYHLEFADKIEADDYAFYPNGIPVVIDPKSFAYVNGCEIDYKYEGLNEGFEFYNPKEKARCGCGESFTI